MPRLRRVDCSGPGYSRRRRGRGFEYFSSTTGEKIIDPETLQRIKDLAIPPAWRSVWICSHPNGHLQAVGTDAAGRKQYLYHEAWRTARDAEKFERMLDFARALPAARRTCAGHLRSTDTLTRDRVLACAARLLDHGFFRIGTEAYTEENDTFGLATMRKEHVRLLGPGPGQSGSGQTVEFDYPAKGGKRRVQHIVDPEVAEVVGTLKRRRTGGEELLAYKTSGRWRDVASADINEFIKDVVGEDFSAKDFRTWNATVLAAVGLAVSGEAADSATARKRAERRTVEEVAHYLGNTATVARKSYIDPRVFDRYQSGWTIAGALEAIGDADVGNPAIQGTVEEAVLDLLEERRSDALERVAS